MQKFALSLVAAVAALIGLAFWSLAWLQWYDPQVLAAWIRPSSEGSWVLQFFVGMVIMGFAKSMSDRAETNPGQFLFIGITGAWGLLAWAAAMDLLPRTWLTEAPTSGQAVAIFAAGYLAILQASRAAHTLNGERAEDSEAPETTAERVGEPS